MYFLKFHSLININTDLSFEWDELDDVVRLGYNLLFIQQLVRCFAVFASPAM